MTRSKNDTVRWLEDVLEKEANIVVDPRIKRFGDETIRGVYGFFVNDVCVYIGKSESIYERMFCANGHLTGLRLNLTGKAVGEERPLQLTLIRAVKENEPIEVKIKEVALYFDDYSRDMQRLASVENNWIDDYQEQGQCLSQLPAGKLLKRSTWEEKKRVKEEEEERHDEKNT